MTWLAALSAIRKYWKLAALGVLVLLLAVQSVRLGHAKNVIERREIDIKELRGELKSISDKRNEQRETTRGNIQRVERNEREAAPIVKIIREAPIPPNCKTPGLDVLRNEI